MNEMSSSKTIGRFFPVGAMVALLLLLSPLAFTSCQQEPATVDITLRKDFDGIADAISHMNTSLEEKLAVIETAMQSGFADSKAAQELVAVAVASLSGTAGEKLAAIESAVKAQTTSLELKLALIEAAVKEGFASGAAQQSLLQQAIEALDGTLEEKLAAIAETVKAQTTSLETKIGLVEAALQEGLADGASAQELLKAAIESQGGTLADKIAAIEKAIGSQTADLSAKLGLIETAVQEGFAEAKAQAVMIQTALDSLSGTMEEKLAAVEKAVTSQTASLETKLDLIDAAVSNPETAYGLIQKAIESLSGTLATKLAAIETALGSETTNLSAKLGLIETAVKDGLAGDKSQQELIAAAIDSQGGDLEEKLTALEKAVTGQTTSLETKLIAIETAVSKGFAAEKDKLELIQKAIETLSGTTEKKLEDIEAAVTSQTTTLGTKLTAIETALNNGIGSVTTAQGLIQSAINAIPGSINEKIGEITKALSDQKGSLDTYLSLIEQAVKNGFIDSQKKQDLIEKAIKGLGDTVSVVTKKLQEAMIGSLSNLDTKLNTIGQAVTDGFAGATDALGLIKEAVEKAQKSIASADTSIVSVTKALADVVQAIKDTDKTITDDVAATLTKILDAIVSPPDYSTLLEQIKEAIEALREPDSITITFSDEYVKNNEVMMLTNDQLSIAYTVTSSVDAEVTVAPSDDITASVVPDPDKPLEGIIVVKSGNSITEGKTQVVVTAANKSNVDKHTLTFKEAYLTPVSSPVDSIPIRFEGETLEIQYKTNLDCAAPAIPDSAKNLVEVLKTEVASDMTTLTISISSNDGDRPRLMGVTIKETRFNKDSLMFTFWQQCDDREIKFEDDGLRRKLVRSGLDVNGDEKISRAEARAAKSLTTILGAELTDGADYESFNEFWYFTGIDTIPEGSFRNWKRLKQITLPESITTIMGGYGDADGPFVDCPCLKSISGKYATADSTALIYESKLLKVVESFEHNNYSKPYEIPEGVNVIGSKAFYKSRLENVKFPESLTKIRDRAFEYSRIDSVVFPKNIQGAAYVDSIAENSFIHCFCLKGFDGPMKEGSVRVTPDYLGLYRDTTFYAFALGADVHTYAIPGDLGIKKLAASVFSVMEKNDKGEDVVNSEVELLLYLGLPSTITHIREHAFSGQTRGLHIYFAGENPPRMDVDVFDYAKDVTLWVPAGADDTENSARIASFSNAIDPKDLHRIKEILTYPQSQWPFSINTSASGTGENFVWD